jgi:hypothetical protein
MMLSIKTIRTFLNVPTNIITNTTDHFIELAVILVIMSVSTFINAVILYTTNSLKNTESIVTVRKLSSNNYWKLCTSLYIKH